MTRESRTVDQSHQVQSPTQRHLPLVDLLWYLGCLDGGSCLQSGRKRETIPSHRGSGVAWRTLQSRSSTV